MPIRVEIPRCDVGRRLTRVTENTPPCPEDGLNEVQFDDDGTGQPMTVQVCAKHLPIVAPNHERIDTDETVCQAGRSLYGSPGFEDECPAEGTEIVHMTGLESGGVVLHMCAEHVAQLPATAIHP